MLRLLSLNFLLALAYGQVITDLASNVKIEEGDNATLSCTAISWHPAAHIEWQMLQDGDWIRIANHGAVTQEFRSKFTVTLSSGDDGSKLISTLDISEVGLGESGIYRCEAYKGGSIQSFVNHTVTVFRNESIETLNITSVTATRYGPGYGSSVAHGFYVKWNYPVGYTSEEKWFYTVHTRYVHGSSIVTKKKDAGDHNPTQNFLWTALYPCTDYQVWVTGYSRRYLPLKKTTPQPRTQNQGRYSRRYNRYYGQSQRRQTVIRTLLPGVYRRAVSTVSAWTSTQNSVPKEVPKMRDIKIEQTRTGNSENCSMLVTWTPNIKPFGCRTLGFELAVKTPDSWNSFRTVKERGITSVMNNISCHMAFPVKLTPFNRYGHGTSSQMFFVQFTKLAPTPPTNLQVQMECNQMKVTWDPPSGTHQSIISYEVTVEQPQNGSSYSGTVVAAETEHTLVSFLAESQMLTVKVKATSYWGVSKPASINVIGKAGCVKIDEGAHGEGLSMKQK